MEQNEPSEQVREAKRYVALSLAIHLSLFLALGIGSFFKGTPLVFTPAVQIDIVALPGSVKNSVPEPVDTSLPVKENAPAPKPEEKTAEKDDSLALESKRKLDAEKRAKSALSKLREQLKKERQDDEEKGRETLEKRKADLERFKAAYRNALKGNQLNQGTSATGALQATVNAYAGHITDRIRSNWTLPRFLQSQDLHAKMVIFLDAGGHVIRMVLTKPSGDSLFDNNVEAAVKKSSPFAPPPAEMASGLRNSGIEVKFPL
jgi:TonB family protein